MLLEGANDPLPPKATNLVRVPLSRLEVVCEAPFTQPLNSYLVTLLSQAGRPRLTEGDHYSYLIRATVVTPPSMTVIKTGGGKVNPARVARGIGSIFGGSKFPQVPETLDLESTNMVVEVRCGVELRLLNGQKDILEQLSLQVIQTNSLKAIGVALNNFRVGDTSPQAVGTYMSSLSRAAVYQALVNFTAYQALVRFLPAADKRFVEADMASPVVAVSPVAPDTDKHPKEAAEASPPVLAQPAVSDTATPPQQSSSATTPAKDDSEWLTPAEAATTLKLTETEVLDAVKKGEIKAKKIGANYRIRRKDLD